MKIANIVKNIFVIILIMAFMFVVSMVVFGFKGYSVASDSMAPTLKRGYVVFVKSISFDELKTGDIVTVKLGDKGDTFTHRVIEIDRENGVFFTKGDNSATKDASSRADDIVGKVAFSLPVLGYISIGMSDRVVLAATVAGFVVLFAVVKIVSTIISKKKEVTENEQIEES